MRRRRANLTLEHLSDRITPATGILRNALGQVVIEGTAGNDSASVSISGSSFIADLNGSTKTFSLASVKSIVFKGLAGDDSFTNNSNRPSSVSGGDGNDVLVGGSSTDKFFGGGGQ